MNELLLSARGLTKTYVMGKRSLEVLRGVDVDIARSDFLALRGASGAGKSTLLHLIGGLDTPNAGEIIFNGQSFADFSESKLTNFRNRSVGFVFQSYHLLPELTALENVCLPARIARISTEVAKKRATELLTRVGLKDRLDHKSSELSGGEQQRVAIARALINEPVLLLADEPTGNLDSRTSQEVLQLFQKLNAEEGITIILVTHDANVGRHAKRVVQISDGLIVAGEYAARATPPATKGGPA